MKTIALTILTIILSSTILFGQKSDLVGFETFLGSEKVEALNMLEKSFDSFLIANFPNQKSINEKTKKFLQVLSDVGEIDERWTFDTYFNSKIIEKVESSGLRKEFWIYGYENYFPYYYHQYLIDSITNENPDTILKLDSNQIRKLNDLEVEIIPIIGNPDSIDGMTYQQWIDSSLSFNLSGQFIFAIDKFSKNDSVIDEYIDAKEAAGDISPTLIASGLLHNNPDMTEPLIKRIILMELYYGIINWDLKNKKTTR